MKPKLYANETLDAICIEVGNRQTEPGSDAMLLRPNAKKSLIFAVKVEWSNITGESAEDFPWCEWVILSVYQRLRKSGSFTRTKKAPIKTLRAGETVAPKEVMQQMGDAAKKWVLE